MKIKRSALRIVGITALLTAAYLPTAGGATTGVSDPSSVNPSTLSNGSAAQATALSALVSTQAAATNSPVAVDDAYTITDGSPLTVLAPGVLGNDTNAVTLMPVTGPTSGALTLKPNGSFTYDPMGTTGTVTFSYKALNGSLASPTAATVTITITSGGGGGSTPPAISPPTAPDGAALYASSCAACHAAGGLSTTLSNAGVVAKMTTGSMGQFTGGLSSTDIQAIADFIVAPGSGGGTGTPPATSPPATSPPATSPPATSPPATPPAISPPTASDGAALYASSCAACHGAGGLSTTLSNAGVVAKMTTGSMGKFARGLSSADIQAIADFIGAPGSGGLSGTPPMTSLPAVITSQGIYQSFCAACHGADGRGTALGPDIVGESRAEIFDVVRQGDGSMPAYSIQLLSDSDLGRIADFLASLGGDDDHDGDSDSDGDDDHDGDSDSDGDDDHDGDSDSDGDDD